MRVSGFTFVRNAIKYDYPILESISSILPLCDEFIVNVGESEDETLELIKTIADNKIKIIESVWDEKLKERGLILSEQTNVALSKCSGDWCFYIQADEVVHEEDLPKIKKCMEQNLENSNVQGLLFNYIHFYGSYFTYQSNRKWYSKEVRIIKNNLGIKSWGDAKGFRIPSDKNPRGNKIKVKSTSANIYHYGWVRHPETMKEKINFFESLWDKNLNIENYDYTNFFGKFERPYLFEGSHPKIMEERIEKGEYLFSNIKKYARKPNRFLEKIKRIGEHKNFIILK